MEISGITIVLHSRLSCATDRRYIEIYLCQGMKSLIPVLPLRKGLANNFIDHQLLNQFFCDSDGSGSNLSSEDKDDEINDNNTSVALEQDNENGAGKRISDVVATNARLKRGGCPSTAWSKCKILSYWKDSLKIFILRRNSKLP